MCSACSGILHNNFTITTQHHVPYVQMVELRDVFKALYLGIKPQASHLPLTTSQRYYFGNRVASLSAMVLSINRT